MYDPILVQPMRDEVKELGFYELYKSEDVTKELSEKGTAFIFVNSVCGCAAGKARPGLKLAIKFASENNFMPDKLLTVFAGMDKEAVETARKYFGKYPPSSPQMALLKDGKIVSMIQRLEIENTDAETVAEKILGIFADHCGKKAVNQ